MRSSVWRLAWIAGAGLFLLGFLTGPSRPAQARYGAWPSRVGATAPGPPATTPASCGGWNVVPSPNPGGLANGFYGVAAVTANDAWAVGHDYNSGGPEHSLVEHWNGTAWAVVPSPNPGAVGNVLQAVAVVAANDVWAVGYQDDWNSPFQTLVEHWDGTTWSVVPSPSPSTYNNLLYGVTAVAANDVWAVGYYYGANGLEQTLIEHWNGSAWAVVASPNPGSATGVLYAVAGATMNDVWAAGYYYKAGGVSHTLVEHWNGTAWAVVPSPSGGARSNVLQGVAVVAANDVWAVGYVANSYYGQQTLIEHWNGTTWTVVASPNPGSSNDYLTGVAGAGATTNEVWAVGHDVNGSGQPQTLVLRWDGTAWAVVPSPTATPYDSLFDGVAVVAANDVWAAGEDSNGSSPTLQTLVARYTVSCATPPAAQRDGGLDFGFWILDFKFAPRAALSTQDFQLRTSSRAAATTASQARACPVVKAAR
ncbi:MAG TPA: hypothetical protein VKY74_26755 [Chloroflexia bacterium]|nr:hypothetical protein [Chloroflexia bacterium]